MKENIWIEKNRKGKEYCENGVLSFEGEHLNGERNGKGKEYYHFNGELIFEGEYLNGKKDGKVKEYNFHNRGLLFEGEYINRKRWNGKGYDINGDFLFEIKDGKGYIAKKYLKENI